MKREIAVCLMLLMASCLLSGVTYADLDDGLVAYYPFEFNTQDASGNEYHCSTPNQELNYVPGATPDGYAVQVDENYGVIEPAPPISSAFTVSFWLNTDTILGQQGMGPEGGTIYTTQPCGEYKGFGIRRDLNALSVFINKGSQTERRLFTSVGFIEPYTWYFITVTYDGSTLRAFSVNEGTITTVMSEQFEGFIPYNNKAVLFRHHTTPREQDFKGKIDDVRIYNRVLTEAEIQELYPYPPAANAGENKSINSEDQSTTILEGTATDPDGDNLEYRWLDSTGVLLDWLPVGANGEADLDLSTVPYFTIGEHTLTLEVRDGSETASDDMILTVGNSAPHVQATGAGVYEIFSDVILGGQVSDYDGDNLSYEWNWDGDTLFSGSQDTIYGGDPVSLPEHVKSDLGLGSHKLTLKAKDNSSEPVSSDITIEIVDTGTPTLAPVANKNILWPPNHKMVDIEIVANANDNSGGPITLSVTVVSNEPIDGTGDGDMTPDWTEPLIDQENGIIRLQLRSERSGSGNGRIYTLSITATDDSDNFSTAEVDISVPHNSGLFLKVYDTLCKTYTRNFEKQKYNNFKQLYLMQ